MMMEKRSFRVLTKEKCLAFLVLGEGKQLEDHL
jgi:hypothetical protein